MRRWILRHPVWFTVILAAAVRIWMLTELPLVITNDGAMYLEFGKDVLAGRLDRIPPIRTPGHPLFMAAVFCVFGVNGLGVLIAQHALGVATCAAIAAAVSGRRGSRHGGRWAAWVGGVAALSPSLWVWESYALTESLAVFLVVVAFVISLCARPRLGWGLLAGLCIGMACLVRPSMQVMAPFVVLGWALRAAGAAGARSGIAGALAATIGFLMMTGPWLAYNASRGVTGMARGGDVTLWWGMAMSDALDRSYPLPPGMPELPAGRASDDQAWQYLSKAGAFSDPEREALVGTWARASIKSHPLAYARGVVRCFWAQMEMRRGLKTDTGWFLWRLAQDGRESGQAAANFQVSPPHQVAEEFRMERRPGPLTRAIDWMARHKERGAPRVILVLAAIIAGVAFLLSRRWGEAILVLGTGAMFGVHALLLLPHSRYGITACACWAILVPDAAKAVIGLVWGRSAEWKMMRTTRRAVRAGVPGPAARG